MRARFLLALVLLGALLPIVPASARAHEVKVRDNFFEPRQIFVDVGDTVTWDGGGFRPHTVTSDTKLFDSGQMNASDEFSFTFRKKGKYYYHCKLHGAAGKGMWGVVIVGDLPKDDRKKIVVPDDYSTIQAAVSAAKPGAAIVIRPGRYSEEVVVETSGLLIRGVDRFRTVLDGGGTSQTGIRVAGPNVTIKNLTITDYADAGIHLDDADDYDVRRVDLIGNQRFGVASTGSNGGSIRGAFAWGSGQAGVHVGRCFACGVLVDRVRAEMNVLGIEVVNATGITVRGSRTVRNGIGLLAHSSSSVGGAPGRGLFLFGNEVTDNNQEQIPAAGMAQVYGLPFGTGIWLAGVKNTSVLDNDVTAHSRYGILVTDDLDNAEAPVNNQTQNNMVTGSGTGLELAWDGSGRNDCFDGNVATTSGPESIQELYPCRLRPFEGTAFAPVRDDVDATIASGPRTNTVQPPKPIRPRCQRGRPGCNR